MKSKPLLILMALASALSCSCTSVDIAGVDGDGAVSSCNIGGGDNSKQTDDGWFVMGTKPDGWYQKYKWIPELSLEEKNLESSEWFVEDDGLEARIVGQDDSNHLDWSYNPELAKRAAQAH